MSGLRVSFIGAGNMALALARGMVRSGVTKSSDIIASSPRSDVALLEKMEAIGCKTTFDNKEATTKSDITVIAVKPNVVGRVMAEIKESVTPTGPLVASIAMGVSISSMEGLLHPLCRVIRCMPNTPALLQEGASVYCRGTHATDEDAAAVESILGSVGGCDIVPESYLNAVTGLSGAGPAYTYLIIEALADGGVQAGLPRALSIRLAAQTLLGGAKMVLSTDQHTGQLRDAVCSPGGCSIAGVAALEASGVRGGLIGAVGEASKRAEEMEKSGE